MFDNLIRAIIEAFYILGWLTRKIFKPIADKLIIPIIQYCSFFSKMSFSVLVVGWSMVSAKMLDNRIQSALEDKEITLDQVDKSKRWYTIQVHSFLIMGTLINITLAAVFTFMIFWLLISY